MGVRKLTIDQKRLDADLWIILIATLAALGVYTAFQSQFNSMVKNGNIHILLRTLVAAICQFSLAGLGISIVAIYRKESFFHMD